MGFFSKLFKGPEIDMEKSNANAEKMRLLFNQAVENGTVPALSGCGAPTYYRRSEILKAYRNKYPTDAFIIYPDRKSYIGINACDWLEEENLYVYVSQTEELAAFTAFFMNRFAKK